MSSKKASNKFKILNWVLLVFWMVFIFYMSSQPAVVSDAQSGTVIKILTELGIDINGIFGELANFIVRKCAHFLEYMILAALFYNVLKYYFDFKQVSILSVIFVFIYACTDEFHQVFVPGREGAFRDVLIDTSGGIVLIILIIIFYHINNKKRNIK